MNTLPRTTQPTQQLTAPRRSLWLPLLCAWMLMLATFSPAEGDAANSFGTLDYFGLAKLAARALALTLLGWTILRHFNNSRLSAVVRCLLPLGLFAAWAVLSTLWSPLRAVSLGQASGLVVLLMLSVVLAMLHSGPRSTSTVLCSLSAGLMLLSSILLFAYLLFPGTEVLGRDGSGLFHSTNAGGMASVALLVLIAARLLWNWRWTRVLLIPGIALHSAVLVLAASRFPAFLAVLSVAVLYFLFANRTLVWGTVVAGSVALGMYLAVDTNLELAENTILKPIAAFSQQSQSKAEMRELSGRSEMWQAMWNSHQQSPWIGHGYFVTSETGELEVWYEWENWTAHNLILQVLVTTGLVGLVLLTCGFLNPAWLVIRRIAGGRGDRKMAYFLLAVGCWYFLRGLLTTSFMGPVQPESVVFFTALGVGVGSLLFAKTSESQNPAMAGATPSHWNETNLAH